MKNDKNKTDSKNYFDDQNYSTIILKNNEDAELIEKKKKTKVNLSQVILNLIDSNKIDLLKLLKENKAQQTLMDLIANPENKANLSKLIALCWESGLDFGNYSSSFFDLALNDDVFVSLEAITVLENIETFSSTEELEKGLKILQKGAKSKHPNKHLLEETRLVLFEKLKSIKA
jgi:hypothetical protein